MLYFSSSRAPDSVYTGVSTYIEQLRHLVRKQNYTSRVLIFHI